MMAISIGLILSMLVARASVNAKIDEIKASVATGVTINPAGISGGMGGGDPLTADQISKVKSTDHVTGVTSTLVDQLGEDDTSLTPSLELGEAGKRMQRFEGASDTMIKNGGNAPVIRMMTPRTSVTGTDMPASTVTEDKITSGEMIDGTSKDRVAMIGKSVAEKNSLKVGDTFTAYDKTFTVKAIFDAENTFANSGIIVPIQTLQTVTDQAGAVTSATATVDSSDNVTSTVATLKTALGDKADITSQEEQAETSLQPLKSIASLATSGVIGAAIAGTAIMLLAMIMTVRERRREIGVIKAIGGSNVKVITQFIAEGLTLAIVGSIIGLGIGVLTSVPITESLVADSQSQKSSGPSRISSGPSAGPARVMGGPSAIGQQIGTNATKVTSTLTPQVFFSSVGIILAVAIIGSAVPAWLIARIRPAEVLRTE